jgi:hypothetical protein
MAIYLCLKLHDRNNNNKKRRGLWRIIPSWHIVVILEKWSKMKEVIPNANAVVIGMAWLFWSGHSMVLSQYFAKNVLCRVCNWRLKQQQRHGVSGSQSQLSRPSLVVAGCQENETKIAIFCQ